MKTFFIIFTQGFCRTVKSGKVTSSGEVFIDEVLQEEFVSRMVKSRIAEQEAQNADAFVIKLGAAA